MHAWYKAMPSQNPIVTEKMYQRKLKKHKQKLRGIKCSVDNGPPKCMNALPKRNLKREQMLEERYSAIERENRLLIEKMAGIMQKSPSDVGLAVENGGKNNKSSDGKFHLKTLNYEYRKREMERIASENILILKRIQKTEPTYSALRWEEERRKHEHILDTLIKNKEFIRNIGKPKKKKPALSDRPKTAQ